MRTDSPAWDEGDEEKPPVGQVALVRCNGYRCMAYRDRQGNWRNYFRGDELRGDVQIIEMFS